MMGERVFKQPRYEEEGISKTKGWDRHALHLPYMDSVQARDLLYTTADNNLSDLIFRCFYGAFYT